MAKSADQSRIIGKYIYAVGLHIRPWLVIIEIYHARNPYRKENKASRHIWAKIYRTKLTVIIIPFSFGRRDTFSDIKLLFIVSRREEARES